MEHFDGACQPSGCLCECATCLRHRKRAVIAEGIREVTLDEAWADAEAALPEGWNLRVDSNGRGTCHASALPPLLPYEEWWAEHREAFDDKAIVAATRALAARLRERATTHREG